MTAGASQVQERLTREIARAVWEAVSFKNLPFQKYFSTYSQFYSVSIRFLLCFTHLQTSDYVVWAEISFVFTDLFSIQG